MTSPKLLYGVGIGAQSALVKSTKVANRGDAFLWIMNNGDLTLQQATDLLDACDKNGKGGCFNVHGLLVQAQKL